MWLIFFVFALIIYPNGHPGGSGTLFTLCLKDKLSANLHHRLFWNSLWSPFILAILQSQFYSSYKSHTRLKGLLGITPSGAASFVSELFTGSISDREVFQGNSLLDMLKALTAGKSVMADKVFDVGDLLAPTGVRVNTPPLLGAQQLSVTDVLRTQHIAWVPLNARREGNSECGELLHFGKNYSAFWDWLAWSDLDNFVTFWPTINLPFWALKIG